MPLRLVRFLAQCGVASRRGAADVVRSGAVRVNGQIVTNMACQIEDDDEVFLGEQRVRLPQATYLLLNKPTGVVCSRSDPHNPQTVLRYVPPTLRDRVKPVGRLDKETSGLLLLTDDGELAFRLTHPRFGVDKTYRARLRGAIDQKAIERLRHGVRLEDGPTHPAHVHVTEKHRNDSIVEITIHEGRNRQVRRMCYAVGFPVTQLERIRFGPLQLGRNLPRGAVRPLTDEEVAELKTAVKL